MRKVLLVTFLAVAAIVAWVIWGNSAVELTELRAGSREVPSGFAGFRLAHVSDLHNAAFYEDVLDVLRKMEPEAIMITGDIVDANHIDYDIALDFVRQAAQIAPCYYVTGNHDSWLPEYDMLEAGMEAAGVEILHNEKLTLTRNGDTITLIGLDDPVYMNDGWEVADDAAMISPILAELMEGEEDNCVLLLSHRPELFDVYTEHGVELTLTGHAHGGQFRLPVIGGLYAPDQGVFPQYTAGIHAAAGTRMIVSRGIGNSVFPLRFNNRPEVMEVTLE